MSAGAAVVELFSAKHAVEEENFSGAPSRLTGGGSRDRDDAFLVGGNLAVLFGDLHLGNFDVLFSFVGFPDVSADGGERLRLGVFDNVLLKIK